MKATTSNRWKRSSISHLIESQNKRAAAWILAPGTISLIFGLYVLPRAAMLLFEIEFTSDAAWYFGRAAELAQGTGYAERGVLTAFWPPGWPMALSVVFKSFGISLLNAQLFNLVCSLLIGWLTLDLGRRLFHSEAAGRMGLLLLAIYPNAIGYVPLVLSEVFYTALLLAGCWLLVATQSWLKLLLAGVVFGVATLVKAQSPIVILLVFGIGVLRDRLGFKQVAQILFVILMAALVVLPWSYRNYKVFGEWVPVSTNGGINLLIGNNPSANGDYSTADPLVATLSRTVETQVDADKVARKRAAEWIMQNPGSFIALMPQKIFRLWAPDGESEWAFQGGCDSYENNAIWFRSVRYLNQVYYAFLIVGFVWSGFLLASGTVRVSPKRFDWWTLPYAMALYPTLIALVFFGSSRFHYVVMPFVTMGCGWLLVSWNEIRQPDNAEINTDMVTVEMTDEPESVSDSPNAT